MIKENIANRIEIDATNQSLGRLASKLAILLMGKNDSNYAPNKVSEVKIFISNIDKLSISEKKKDTKNYLSYSGYPGGLKTQNLRSVIDKKGYQEALLIAVKGMLPKNKLQSLRLKNLNFK